MAKVRDYKEKRFAKMLEKNAPYFGCYLIDVPDVVPTKYNIRRRKKGKGKTIAAKRRPCDSILVTPKTNIMLELKAETNPSKHQRETAEKVYNKNGKFFILRKTIDVKKEQGRVEKIDTTYSVEVWNTKSHQTIFECDDLEELFGYFLRI